MSNSRRDGDCNKARASEVSSMRACSILKINIYIDSQNCQGNKYTYTMTLSLASSIA